MSNKLIKNINRQKCIFLTNEKGNSSDDNNDHQEKERGNSRIKVIIYLKSDRYYDDSGVI